MIRIPATVYVASAPIDLRLSFDRLAGIVRDVLGREPRAEAAFVFHNRARTHAKILWHDGIGLSLYAKRLDRGKFIWPSASGGAISISAAQMAYMLEGIDWRNPQLTWRPESAG